jgi:hypothetical protein
MFKIERERFIQRRNKRKLKKLLKIMKKILINIDFIFKKKIFILFFIYNVILLYKFIIINKITKKILNKNYFFIKNYKLFKWLEDIEEKVLKEGWNLVDLLLLLEKVVVKELVEEKVEVDLKDLEVILVLEEWGQLIEKKIKINK